MPAFQDIIKNTFPSAVPIDDYFNKVKRISEKHGFNANSTIGGIANCADELERKMKEPGEMK